ncbi:MAG: YfhO family protein [Clostridia bacterium]|nr:YfhO family protein [Clostridia bacterium]
MKQVDLNQNPTSPFRRFSSCDLWEKPQKKLLAFKGSYLLLCFIIPAVLMYLLYLTRNLYPFGDGSVLVLDLNGQYVYFYEALRNTVYGEGSFLYTFFRGLGGEFMGMYAYYLASPLSYIVALFPQSRILEALLVIILIKVGLCGFTFGFYLHKNSTRPQKLSIIIFSVLYALSAYSVIYQNNIMWLDALIWLPLLTYSIEQLIKNHRYKLFVISLALTVMSNYYIGYMVCIYVALYFFYYLLANSKETLNPHNERAHTLRSLGRIALFSLLALAISAVIIFGAYYSLGLGKNDFSTPNWSFKTKFELLDFFTKFLPGSYDTVRPNGLPNVYCGILMLLLVPVYFLTKKIKGREKIASALFIVIFVFSFIISPLDLIWHGFQNPNWLNYRYSFMLIFFLLVLAYKGLGNIRQVGERFVACVGAIIILFAMICGKLEFSTYVESDSKLLQLETVWLTALATVAIMAALMFLIRAKTEARRNMMTGILAAIVCVEVFCSSVACMNQFNGDVLYSKYSSYNGFLSNVRPIVDRVKDEDSGFYRMEKLNHRKYNDNMALGIRGLSNSTSTLNAETIQFLNRMGYTARSHLSQYRGGTPVNDSLLGVKYLIDSKGSQKLVHYYDEMFTEGSYTAYENPYALSIAYGVSDETKNLDLSEKMPYFSRLNKMVKTMLGHNRYGDVFRPISGLKIKTESATVTTNSTITTYKQKTSDQQAYVNFTFTAKYSGEYYFYPYNSASTECELWVNNETKAREKSYLGKDTNTIYSLGWFDEGQEITVSLRFKTGTLKLYRHYDYFWYIDRTAFDASFDELKNGPQFLVDENYTEDCLTGTIHTDTDHQMIQTTIPYDEGWKVYLDNQEIKIYKTMDALIAFDIEESGAHELTIAYRPSAISGGLIISCFGLLSFVAIWIVDSLLIKRKKSKKESCNLLLGEAWVLDDFDSDYDAIALPEEITDSESAEGPSSDPNDPSDTQA